MLSRKIPRCRIRGNINVNPAIIDTDGKPTVTSTATYATSNSAKLTGLSSTSTIPIGALVTGTGVGREVYVTAKTSTTLTLSQPLFGGSATRSYTFKRFQYMLDFSGFTALSKFEIVDVEMIAGGFCLLR